MIEDFEKDTYKKGYLKVNSVHSLYYECYGNPTGKPVLFLHGGPGAGFSDADKRFFNPSIFNVILFDQRGASHSQPFGNIEENTTQDLVNDINRLLDFLNIGKVLLFGGSWGSTLALVYAIQHAERVTEMLLRGIFLGNKASIDYFINGGVKEQFPKVWARFENLVPQNERDNIPTYYLNKMLSKDEEVSNRYAFEWAYYEMSIYKQGITSDEEIKKLVDNMPFKSLAIMEAHYCANYCFIPDDYILNNIKAIENIKTVIVQGQHDVICPPIFAEQLHQAFGQQSTLHLVNAGHASSEPAIEAVLKKEVENFSGER